MQRIVGGRSADFIPDIYVDYILCKTFHCLPSQIEKEDNKKLEIFLYIMRLESDERNRELRRQKHGR